MCSLRKCELFLCISKCNWGVLHTSNRSGTSIEIKFDSKIKLTHLINVWREWDRERNTHLIHSYHVRCTCMFVCVAMAFFVPISMFSVQMTDTHYSSLQVGFFLCLSHCFFYGLVFFPSSLTPNIVLFHEIMNELWIKCNTFKDWTRLKMTIDRQSIRSTLDALALEIVSSHVCAC